MKILNSRKLITNTVKNMTVLLLNHEILEKGNANVLFLKPKYVQSYLFKEIETGVGKN